MPNQQQWGLRPECVWQMPITSELHMDQTANTAGRICHGVSALYVDKYSLSMRRKISQKCHDLRSLASLSLSLSRSKPLIASIIYIIYTVRFPFVNTENKVTITLINLSNVHKTALKKKKNHIYATDHV